MSDVARLETRNRELEIQFNAERKLSHMLAETLDGIDTACFRIICADFMAKWDARNS